MMQIYFILFQIVRDDQSIKNSNEIFDGIIHIIARLNTTLKSQLETSLTNSKAVITRRNQNKRYFSLN